MREKNVFSGLQNPEKSCSQAPFWFWNGELDAKEFQYQVNLMAEQGVFGSTPHPRFGMDRREYLGPKYWKAIKATIEETKKNDGQVILYDEYNWPSGGAGGRVTASHPEFYPRAMDYMLLDFVGPKKVLIDKLIPSEKESETPEKILAAFLVPSDFPFQIKKDKPGMSLENTGIKISSFGHISKDGLSVSGRIPPGKNRIVIFFRAKTAVPSPLDSGSGSFVDFMNKEATELFINLTHKEYEKRFKQHFGKTVTGMFTDEPQALAGGPFPWTAKFEKEFIKRHGYDLLEKLPALIDDRVKDGWKYRAAYWQTVSGLIDENFFAPVAKWCKRNKIAFTGHIFDEHIKSWPSAPHLMNWLKNMDWPGIDALEERITPLGTKIPSSVAHLYGRPHFLCEALGIARGWNATLSMAKRGYNFLALMGVDILVPHAFFQTAENPRVECPPSFFFQNPYWKYYKKLADMTSRLCAYNRIGRHVASTLIYYPIESLWADSTGGKGQNVFPWQCKNIGNVFAYKTTDAFNNAVMALSAREHDIDVIDNKLLLTGKTTTKGEIVIGPERFSCIVLPEMRTIEYSSLVKLDEFINAGGNVVIIGALPKRAMQNEDISGLYKRWFKGPLPKTNGQWKINSGRLILISSKTDISLVLNKYIPKNIVFKSGLDKAVYCSVRKDEENTVWLIVNDGEKEKNLSLELPARLLPDSPFDLSLFDPVTGVYSAIEYKTSAFGVSVKVKLQDRSSLIIIASTLEQPKRSPVKGPLNLSIGKRVELKDWTFQLVQNSLDNKWSETCLPEWIGLPVWKAVGRSWRRMKGWTDKEYDDSNWKTVVTPRRQALLEDEVALMRTLLPPGASAIKMPLPVSGEYVIYINGKLVEKRFGLPPKNGILNIEKYVNGLNDSVALEVSAMNDFSGLLGPLEVLCKPVKLKNLSGWGKLGLGWYSGRGIYSTKVNISENIKGPVWLDLNKIEHYAEVWINGKLADTLIWSPYKLDISKSLVKGNNRVTVIVSNSVSNRFVWDGWGTRTGLNWGLDPVADPSGLLGPATLTFLHS